MANANAHLDDVGRKKIFVKEHTESLVKQLMNGDLAHALEDRRALEDSQAKIERLGDSMRKERITCGNQVSVFHSTPKG